VGGACRAGGQCGFGRGIVHRAETHFRRSAVKPIQRGRRRIFEQIDVGECLAGVVQQMKAALGGIPIQRAMIKDFRALSPSDSLVRAVEHVLAGFQQDFPVVEDGRVVGVLTRNDLLKTLSQRGPDARVEEAMQRQFETADPNEMLETVFARLNAYGCHSLPLVRNGQLAGLVTMDNIGEFLMVQAALAGKG